LDAILVKYPSFNLSSFDQLRRRIVEDADLMMNNDSVNAFLLENGLDGDPTHLQKCHNLAYRINHPYIFPLPKVEVLSSEYTLNFLWVNLNPQNRMLNSSQNIFGHGLEPAENAKEIQDPTLLRELEQNSEHLSHEALQNWFNIKESFTYRLSKWADLHKDATIYLWYDSALVTQTARQKTDEMLKSISLSRGVQLSLRDVRSLTNMDEELRLSLHPGTALYYRVDLLKALIGDHMISSSEESAKYCVFTDIDVEAMPVSQLFDERTLEYLNTKGYVFNRLCVAGHFENSFFIFDKEFDEFRQKHRESIIEATSKHITNLRYFPTIHPLSTELIMDSQFVFGLYRRMRKEINDLDDEFSPRKVVKCPKSQFATTGAFRDSSFQSETFRFVGDSKIPSTKWGRNHQEWREVPIPWLKHWKEEPLPEFN